MLEPLRPCAVLQGPIREWAGRRCDQSFCALQRGNPDIQPDLRFIYHAPMAFFAFLIVRELGWIFRWGRPHCANELEILVLRHQLKVLRRSQPTHD